jgi:hypothetical protein
VFGCHNRVEGAAYGSAFVSRCPFLDTRSYLPDGKMAVHLSEVARQAFLRPVCLRQPVTLYTERGNILYSLINTDVILPYLVPSKIACGKIILYD